ncbi:MAG: phosphatidylserine decarboxylase [Legionellales bacterium]|nr:phosphatidylserine decarboxylase [Legionellales bacterium]
MKKKIFVILQYVLPQKALSRLAGYAMESTCSWWKNALIRKFLKTYPVNMSEALNQDPFSYPTFNDFFTRKLQPAVRPIAHDSTAIASPADGTISQIGSICEGRIIQAKNTDFTVLELLGGDTSLAEKFKQGIFTTIYLAPQDYHHVHMPLAGTLRKMTHIPGTLFSVNQTAAEAIPRLFARNERVVFFFETETMPMVVVMVGAFLVRSIATPWSGTIAPSTNKTINAIPYEPGEVSLAKGQEIGHFKFGSTAIVLFPEKMAQWLPHLQSNMSVKMGQAIGKKIV